MLDSGEHFRLATVPSIEMCGGSCVGDQHVVSTLPYVSTPEPESKQEQTEWMFGAVQGWRTGCVVRAGPLGDGGGGGGGGRGGVYIDLDTASQTKTDRSRTLTGAEH